jgi:hypothetical protein
MAEVKMDPQVLAMIALIPTMPLEKLVKLTLHIRNQKALLKRAVDVKEANLDAIVDACENTMLAEAHRQGVKGFKTTAGTTYTSSSLKVSIADAEAFYGFVLAQGDLDFFERRVASLHVQEYMAENKGVLPPGLNVFTQLHMRVRKNTGE